MGITRDPTVKRAVQSTPRKQRLSCLAHLSPGLRAVGGWLVSARTRTETGVLFIAAAVGLHILGGLLGYLWASVLPLTVPAGQESFYYSLHVIWIPLTGVLVIGASAALVASGYLLIRRHADFGGPAERSLLGLAQLAFVVALVAAVLRFLAGLILGFVRVTDVTGLRTGLVIDDVGLAIALGLSLNWLLLGLGVRQARIAGVVALVAGSTSSVLSGVSRVALRGEQLGGVDALVLGLGFLSLVLWFALYLWGYEDLHLRGPSQPVAATS